MGTGFDLSGILSDIATLLSERAKGAVRRRMTGAILVGIALFFVGIALVAGIVALGVALAARFGVLGACLIIAAGALVVAVVLVGVVAAQARAARRRRQAEAAQLRQMLVVAKAIVPDVSAGYALLIAAAAGLIVGLKGTAARAKDHDCSGDKPDDN